MTSSFWFREQRAFSGIAREPPRRCSASCIGTLTSSPLVPLFFFLDGVNFDFLRDGGTDPQTNTGRVFARPLSSPQRIRRSASRKSFFFQRWQFLVWGTGFGTAVLPICLSKGNTLWPARSFSSNSLALQKIESSSLPFFPPHFTIGLFSFSAALSRSVRLVEGFFKKLSPPSPPIFFLPQQGSRLLLLLPSRLPGTRQGAGTPKDTKKKLTPPS